ncbi:MAG: PHP domain-containing protein, partial [Peptococcaceae bacterium]|nr:PHP domain-containing protein [Peptococcaceae bacterium]
LAQVIVELASTGKSTFHAELKEKVPVEFAKLLHIPGIGVKTIRAIMQELKPQTLEELEIAVEKRRIRQIKGLSSKTEAKLKRGLALLQEPPEQFSLGLALPLGRELQVFLAKLPYVTSVAIVGSTIRGRETVRDLDLVVASNDFAGVKVAFGSFPKIERLLDEKDNYLRAQTWFGLPVDIHIVAPEVFEQAREHFSGDIAHHAKLRRLAEQQGLSWEMMPLGVYRELSLPAIPPELREGEVDLKVPDNLLQLTDLAGDLHMHTRWSDGGQSVRDMAFAAVKKNYAYIAICDHSRNLTVAKGLQPEQLLQQREEIDTVNAELAGRLKVLAGAETDILKDGSMDFPDDVLAELDVVVASVHMRYKQDSVTMTQRIESALKNPHVDILAHPTGRLVGRRDPFDVDLAKVFEIAAKNKKALEINASPARLDLKDKYAAMARDWGVPIVIDTDAHDTEELDDMEYGVLTARRAGLARGDVLNTKSLSELEKWLNKR